MRSTILHDSITRSKTPGGTGWRLHQAPTQPVDPDEEQPPHPGEPPVPDPGLPVLRFGRRCPRGYAERTARSGP